MSPGAALLRRSRLFSVPKPLPEPPSANLLMGDHKSSTMTRPYPQHQSITSPLSSREKGDWGYKRPFPLKSTMTTSTPLIRVKQVDSIESITDFTSAADLSLSLEKFQELQVAMSVPRAKNGIYSTGESNRWDMWSKSVFEEDSDFTDPERRRDFDKRWKFNGPWLARMTEGDFSRYLTKVVRPKRAQFRTLLRTKLAEDMTLARTQAAMDDGKPAPPVVEPRDITEEQFTEYLRSLRNDRATLYKFVTKFLDLAPLGTLIGVKNAVFNALSQVSDHLTDLGPYGRSGPPLSHPSAGISYLRTNSFMENHPVYGPQARRAPSLARIIYPRVGHHKAKLGLGGFVADVPAGDNEFNYRFGKSKSSTNKVLNGVAHLDTKTYGGAKVYVEPQTASVDPSGKIILKLRPSSPEAQVVAKEAKGMSQIYQDAKAEAHGT